MIYTYLVDHGTASPTVEADMEVNGGTVVAVQFSDAFDEIDRFRVMLEKLEDHPQLAPCPDLRREIHETLNPTK